MNALSGLARASRRGLRRAPATQARRLATVILVLLLAALAAASPAQAHAQLVSTTPAADALLTEAPDQVTLTFSEQIDPTFVTVRVSGRSGSVTTGDPVVEGPVVTQPVSPDVGAGRFTVTFRVVSADGHPISATFGYDLAGPATEAESTSAPLGTATDEPVSAGARTTSSSSASATAKEPVDAGASAEGSGVGVWVIGGAVMLAMAAAARTLSRQRHTDST